MRYSLLAVVSLLGGCGAKTPAVPSATTPLYTDLGTFSVPISTKIPLAQQYFDQGMRLTYAFNHAEAIKAFEEAARLDPNCAICYWGVALASGPNINAPMDSASGVAAWGALERARAVRDHASERERALIDALGRRYQAVPPAVRGALDSAYAQAIGELAGRMPDDREVAVLHAEALMDLRPWDYWEAIGKPRPGTETAAAELTRVIAADSSHPGACHYFIHLYEATEPARALPCAERLAALMPGAGHIVHMPAHIYIRVGRYADAIEHNEHATHADSTYVASERASPTYAGLYVPHNFHFLGFAAMLAGREDVAVRSGKRTVETMPVEAAHAFPEYQPMLVFHHQILQKFGRWEELIGLPLPDSTLVVARVVGEYLRGTALAATGRIGEAKASLAAAESRPLGTVSPIAEAIVSAARHSLAGEIAARQKSWAEAERHFRAAMAVEDGFTYMEPPWWIEPVRHSLGTALLASGNAAGAERLFREDLARFPNNVWALAGLEASLRAQGKSDPAVTAEAAKARAVAGGEVTAAHR
jgi:tetratricopeptide (TPR) repeat protein